MMAVNASGMVLPFTVRIDHSFSRPEIHFFFHQNSPEKLLFEVFLRSHFETTHIGTLWHIPFPSLVILPMFVLLLLLFFIVSIHTSSRIYSPNIDILDMSPTRISEIVIVLHIQYWKVKIPTSSLQSI